MPAALRFYHDHLMDKTARSNWFGLQGMFLTTDPREAEMGLPAGKFDIPLAVTDRSFRADNRLTDPFRGMSGDGRAWAVRARRPSVTTSSSTAGTRRTSACGPGCTGCASSTRRSSTYDFALSNGQPMTQIGTGSGLLPQPVVRPDITLGPAQRADVVVDFRDFRGDNVQLQSILPVSGDGTTASGSWSSECVVTRGPKFKVPRTLDRSTLPGAEEGRQDLEVRPRRERRQPPLDDQRQTVRPEADRRRIRLGSVQRWKLENTSGFTHFIHLHEELWRTLKRDGHRPPPWERGYEDTWRLDPGESVIVAARFTDFTGKFMIHCHMLDHEDDGMMATFEVTRR